MSIGRSAASAGLVVVPRRAGSLARPVSHAAPGHCPRCGEQLAWRHEHVDPAHVGVPHRRRRSSTCRPTCCRCSTTNTLVSSESDTIMSGVVYLYDERVVAARPHRARRERDDPARQDRRARRTCWSPCSAASATSNRQRTRLYRIVEFIGRWSMLDVFVDTFIVALVQLSPLMSVEPGPGRRVLHGGRGADDVRGDVVRSAPDLGRGPRTTVPATERRWRPSLTDDDLPEAVAVPPRRARFSPIWIVPILAALVAIGIVVRAHRKRRADDHHHVQVGGRHRGRQDLRQVQGSQHRAGDGRAPHRRRRRTSRSPRKIAKSAARLMVEDAQVLGRAPAHQPVRRVRPVDAHLRQLHRLRGGTSKKKGRHVHRARSAADRHRRHRPAASSCCRRPTWARSASARPSTTAGCRSARSSPTTSRRTASRCVLRIFVNAPYDKYVTARHALLERERHRRVADRERPRRAHAIARRAARRRHRVRGAARADVDSSQAAAETAFTLFADRVDGDEGRRVDRHAVRAATSRNRCAACPSARRSASSACRSARSPTSGLSFDPKTLDVRPRVEVARLSRARGRAAARAAGSARLQAMVKEQSSCATSFMQKLVEQRGLRAQLATGSLRHRPAVRVARLLPEGAEGARRLDAAPTPSCRRSSARCRRSRRSSAASSTSSRSVPLDAIGRRHEEGAGEPRRDAARRALVDPALRHRRDARAQVHARRRARRARRGRADADEHGDATSSVPARRGRSSCATRCRSSRAPRAACACSPTTSNATRRR